MMASNKALLFASVLWATLVTFPFGVHSFGVDSHFNCLRRNQTCKNGGECVDYGSDSDGFGRCSCPNDGFEFRGYDCSFNVTGVSYTSDDKATCITDDDGRVLDCMCEQPDYFGADCSRNRVYLKCQPNGMDVLFAPIEPFEGLAYTGNDSDSDHCRVHYSHYDYLSDPGDLVRIFENYFRYDDDDEEDDDDDDQDENKCGLSISNSTDGENVNTTYTLWLTIQYDPMFQTGLDLILPITCVHLDNGTWTTQSSFAAERKNFRPGDEIRDTYFPIGLAFYEDGDFDNLIEESVYLGQTIYMKNWLDTDHVHQATRVISCTFSNSDGTKKLVAIQDGCPTDQSSPLDFEGPLNEDETEDDFSFKAFRFGSDPVVKVSCRIRLCKEENRFLCEKNNCNNNPRIKRSTMDEEDAERRRRFIRSVSAADTTTTRSLNVLDPYEESGKAFQVTADKCMAEPVVKAVGISLITCVSVLVLVSISMAICLCRMLMTKREMGLKMKLKYLQENPTGVDNEGFQKASNDGGRNANIMW